MLTRYDELTAAQSRVAVRLQEELAQSADPFVAAAVERLDTIPGIGTEVAQTIVAEIGTDLTKFPSDRHLASWAGLCPGNHQSAGKRLSGRIRHGNHNLRTALVQAVWAATRTKHTSLAAQYRRLVKRKGKQKALVVVAQSLLVIVYHVLQRQENYHELGGDYFDRQAQQQPTTTTGATITIAGLPRHHCTPPSSGVTRPGGSYFQHRIDKINRMNTEGR